MHPHEDLLNPTQREAVEYDQGPLLVLAGPGSGKTRVLTHRIAHLVRVRRVDPLSILAITFTNKAAEEMRDRVEHLLGPSARRMWIGTFHATCARILRSHIDRLGFERNFVIYDNADQLRLIRSCLRACGVSETKVRPAALLALLDRAKNRAVDPLDLARQSPLDAPALSTAVAAYAQAMKQANALDFGDLIVLVLRLFEENPDILSQVRGRFPSILVDEYQDTNRAQHSLLRGIVSSGRGLCVAGDDDQAIYQWRGAEVENMLSFQEDFPGSRVITLQQNYRSTVSILEAAQAVARENPRRMEKRLWSAKGAGEPLVWYEGETPEAEAVFVASRILSLVASKPVCFRDVGVFYRTNAQSRPLEERFLAAGIPYRVVGALRFYDRAEIKDLMAYLRVVYNPRDSVSLLRVLNRPARGIGAVRQERLEAQAAGTGRSVWETLEQGLDSAQWQGAVRASLERFRQTILSLSTALDSGSAPGELLRRVLEDTRYEEFLATLPDGDRRAENVDELVHAAAAFPRPRDSSPREWLGAFCERVALVTGADAADGKPDGVSLMTLHCAKGLEFSVVFMTGVEARLLPHDRASLSTQGMDEERRLCYVGMTRAKENLYLCRSRTRTVHGKRFSTRPSPFLSAIPSELILDALDGERDARSADPVLGSTGGGGAGAAGRPLATGLPNLAPPAGGPRAPGYRVGDRILHETLGEGKVFKVERSVDREKIVVVFSDGKIRKLVAQNAPIEKLP